MVLHGAAAPGPHHGIDSDAPPHRGAPAATRFPIVVAPGTAAPRQEAWVTASRASPRYDRGRSRPVPARWPDGRSDSDAGVRTTAAPHLTLHVSREVHRTCRAHSLR